MWYGKQCFVISLVDESRQCMSITHTQGLICVYEIYGHLTEIRVVCMSRRIYSTQKSDT